MKSENRFALALEIGTAITGNLVLDEVLALAAQRIAVALDAFECDIYVYSPDDHTLKCMAFWEADYEPGEEVWMDEPIAVAASALYRRVIEERETVEVHSDDRDLDPVDGKRMKQWGEYTVLCTPLLFGDSVIGAVELTEKRRQRCFSDDERELLATVAPPTAVAIHNAILYQQVDEQHRQVSAILEASQAITSTVVLEEVLNLVAEKTAQALNAPRCYIYEYDAAANVNIWRSVYHRDPMGAEIDPLGTAYPLDDWPEDSMLARSGGMSEMTVSDEDISGTTRNSLLEWGETSQLSVLLKFGDHTVGVMEIAETAHERHFTDLEKDLARGLGEQAAVAIHNAQLYRTQEIQNRRVTALLDSSRAVSSTVVFEDVLRILSEQATQALSVAECYIYEYDAANNETVLCSMYRADGTVPELEEIGERYSLVEYDEDRRCVIKGEVVELLASDETLSEVNRTWMAEYGEQSILMVPLRHGDQPLGLLELSVGSTERHFKPDEIELARALGDQAAVAMRNAQLFRAQTWRSERLVSALRISEALNTSLAGEEVALLLGARVSELFPIPLAHAEARVRDALGRYVAPGSDAKAGARIDRLVRRALSACSPQQGKRGKTPRLIVPFVLQEAVSGYLDIVAGSLMPFSDGEIELMQLLANQTAVAIENARLYQAVEQQAITDGLTGLYNHRYFYERLENEMARARRYSLPVSLLMLDIDDFKGFNDSYGHPAGDRVLSEVGAVLRAQLRTDVDIACRYGGEEFAIILPHTPTVGARAVGSRIRDEVGGSEPAPGDPSAPPRGIGERIRQSIADRQIDAGSGGHVTVSIGVASFPEHAGDASELVGHADKALYVAKRMGKNRVEVYSSL